jgi:hypothetical protein
MLPINILSSIFLPYLSHVQAWGGVFVLEERGGTGALVAAHGTHTLTLSWLGSKVQFLFLSWYYGLQARCV